MPMMPLAPSRPLLGVPSRSRMAWSTAAGSANDFPTSASASSPLTLPTAVSTPFPPYLALSPSRSSTASRDPVDAPDGTPARAVVPSARVTVTARVGPPRESRISTACTAVISSDVLVMAISLVGHRQVAQATITNAFNGFRLGNPVERWELLTGGLLLYLSGSRRARRKETVEAISGNGPAGNGEPHRLSGQHPAPTPTPQPEAKLAPPRREFAASGR